MAESTEIDDRLLIPAEDVARLLSVSKRAVWKCAAAGMIPRPVKLGRRTLWRRGELERWVEKGCPPCRRGRW